MKHKNLRYLTREGIKNIGVNRLMSLASIAVLMSCLVMIGCAVLLYLNINQSIRGLEAQNVIMVFLEKKATEEAVEEVKTALETNANVDSVRHITKEEAYNDLLDSMDEKTVYAFRNIKPEDCLTDAFEVKIKNMELFAQSAEEFGALDHVLHVRENRDLAQRLEKIRTAVTYVCSGIIALLFFVALFIIANTIRITMYTRRLEISIMKAVGATNSFIRWPFLIEGINIGLIAAALSMGVLYLIYHFSGEALTPIFSIFGGKLIEFKDYAWQIAVGFVGISVITAGLGSIISIGKYLREQGSVVDEAH